MNIVVILKQTFDTEEKIQIDNGNVSEDGVKFIINPYDEYAVEEAIRVREAHGGQVTVVSAGPERCAEALRTALAMGADEAVRIELPEAPADEHVIANLIAAYVRSQPFDLILGGNFSVDQGAGQVAIRLAERLGLPHAGSITRLELENGKAVAHRDAEGDTEVVEVMLPALFTAQQGLNDPRYPTLPGIMKAKKKPFQVLTAADLNVPPEELEPRTAVRGLSLPPARQAGRILKGDPPQQAKELVRLLREESKVL